ncbi:MAG TPA: hypothetical protein VFZ70_03530 [Euzebyales bacterium]
MGLILAIVLVAAALAGPASAAPGAGDNQVAHSPELTETTRLDDRRAVVIGERWYQTSTADGLYPAMGFHTRGEMGGMWSPPIKLLDGMWFNVGGRWLGDAAEATSFSSGWGYHRIAYAARGGLTVDRTDVAPDGVRAGLIGLTLTSNSPRRVRLLVDAHSELMSTYPWGETDPSQLEYNLADDGSFDASRGRLVFSEQGTPPVANALAHDWTAVVGSTLSPEHHRLGRDFRGPQDPAVICPASGPDAPEQPERCDDTEYGRGAGGRMTYRVKLRAGEPTTVWFAVGGSDASASDAHAAVDAVLADPTGQLGRTVAEREAEGSYSVVDLPGDRLLERSVEWSKQNLLASDQIATDLQLRSTNAGQNFPAPEGTVEQARWLGAGWPDYPWIFGTDGEYTAFASVAMGQFDAIKAHLRALRDVSEIINDGSGKVVHEVTPDGAVYFGANEDPGNTDETAKFPSAVALIWRWTGDDAFRDDLYDFSVRGMRYIVSELDDDGDGWPEGLGNVERPGMGEEKLDNAVYTIRGLYDLADMARAKGDDATADWAAGVGADMASRFEDAWWYGGDTRSYADSLTNPTNERVFQRHWIGVTPMDALLPRQDGPSEPLASEEHGNAALDEREENCYTDELGLWHTGTGPTSAEGGNPGPSCDSVVSEVPSERNAFSLNTGIMAVAEGNFGRLGTDQQQHYTTANARIQLDPSIWEQPGAMPEIAPAGDFTPNIDRLFTERSMVLQAWGAYGTLWPVVHQQLGVAPDLGRDTVAVAPKIPDGQQHIAGDRIRLGDGLIAVEADRRPDRLQTVVEGEVDGTLAIGHVLPDGADVAAVTLDGATVPYDVLETYRGRQVVVDAGAASGRHVLDVQIR